MWYKGLALLTSKGDLKMRLQEVIRKALSDSAFADQLRKNALAAIKASAGTQEWLDFLKDFKVTPDELKALTTPDRGGFGGDTPGSPTNAKLIAQGAIAGPAATLTTTTTTTSFACKEGTVKAIGP